VSLNRYPLPASDPLEWLSQVWAAEDAALPPFETLTGDGRILLLLDGLNEMPHRSADHYAGKVEQWRAFLQAFSHDRNRAVFTCRSLDYSASLSSEAFPIAHANLKPLAAGQIEAFLKLHLPGQGERVFGALSASEALLGLYATPYHLSMLVKLIRAGGDVPQGRAELFTFIVREALHREVCERKTPPLLDPALLSIRDQTQINTGRWTGHTLPERGVLVPSLTTLAFDMQRNQQQGRSGQVSLALQDALDLIRHPRADDVLRAGEHLGLVEEDLNKNRIAFSHQLFQEYFAARKFARQLEPSLAVQEWRADRIAPSIEQALATLSPSDPLPALPSSGWEETAQMAVALSDHPDEFVRSIAAVNLPLAGLCAAVTDARVSAGAKDELRQALIQRTQDTQADLRARIAAGLALGALGDPRFARHTGPHGDFLLPPMVDIPAGRYTLGSNAIEDGDFLIKNPLHTVEIDAFRIGAFAVTNAEFKCFVASGGYENGEWWDTPAANAWRIGAGENLGQVLFYRNERVRLRAMSESSISDLVETGKITIQHAEGMLAIRNMSDSQFEAWLEGQCAIEARQVEPRFWTDPNYNNPAQPMVGICWHEARAYCNWLRAQSGLAFRLPTEAEWEAAARGPAQRLYPFGNRYDARLCNCFEWHIKKTTPVGIFPPLSEGEDDGGWGAIYDLAGNTWEWTSSAPLDYPYAPTPEREDPHVNAGKRIFRGGSWLDSKHSMLASERSTHHPAYRDYYVGFRLAADIDAKR
jgi:formylglycine-generating enzyme required for sulfatase activity